MGAVHRMWLSAALVLTACAGSDAEPPRASSEIVLPAPAAATTVLGPERLVGPEPIAETSPALLPGAGLASDDRQAAPLKGPAAISEPEFPAGWTLSLRARQTNSAEPVVNHPHTQSHSHPVADKSGSDSIWRDIPPGAADEGGHSADEYQLPPASLESAWTEDSSGGYRVLRPATRNELGGFRVISPPPAARDWMTRCVNRHADPSVSSPWPQDVRVSQAVLGCTTSAGLMEQAIQLYGAERGCVQQAYSDDYSVVNGQGNSWTQCPTIGNPTPLDGRPFAEKCRDAVLRGMELKGHPPLEEIAASACVLFEADLAAHLEVPGATLRCAEHWVLNAVLKAEAPGAVPGLQQHAGVNTNGTC